jgi:hypothetical protein
MQLPKTRRWAKTLEKMSLRKVGALRPPGNPMQTLSKAILPLPNPPDLA